MTSESVIEGADRCRKFIDSGVDLTRRFVLGNSDAICTAARLMLGGRKLGGREISRIAKGIDVA
jgi:hypothetical protein